MSTGRGHPWRRLHPSKLALIPKGGRLEVQFGSRPDGAPEDMQGLLQRLVDRANEQFPFRYRLDVAGDSFSLVPTHTRDLLGHVVEIIPLLDRRITIPLGNRTVAETINLMTAQLSATTSAKCLLSVTPSSWRWRSRSERDESLRQGLLNLRPNGPLGVSRRDSTQ